MREPIPSQERRFESCPQRLVLKRFPIFFSSTRRETFINSFFIYNTMIPKKIWEELIADFYERELPKIIERDIDYPLQMPIKRAISIIGPRRSGKTYSMFQTIKKLSEKGVEKDRILYMNFEDSRLINLCLEDMNLMLNTFFELYPQNKKKKIWFFLDEIQNVEGWERFVRSILDRENICVYLTGSSSKLLSKEISTSLRGRTLSYQVFPFSFSDYLKAVKVNSGKPVSSYQKAKLRNAFDEYLVWGGYPETIIYKEERSRILKEIEEVTIYRDIIERYKVENTKVLKILFTQLIHSKEFSIHKFFNFLKSQGIKVGKNTLYNYFEYISDSLVMFPLRKFSYSYREVEQSIPKIYFVDNGLLTLKGIRDLGRLMENLVFIELKRKGFVENETLFYYKSPDKKEVDFVIKEKTKIKQLIQVCYDIEDYNTKERELKSLVKASKELECSNLLVITLDYEGTEMFKGKKIKFISLLNWI